MKKSTSLACSAFLHNAGKLSKLFFLLGLASITQQKVLASEKSVSNSNVVQQNTIQIKGKVFDEKGQPAIGANVVVKGTTNGTITDLDGNYLLKVIPKSTIVVTYIGYQPQQFTLNGKSVININLVVDSKNLEEVVVVGYGQVKRANLVGAVTNISAEKIKDIPATNLAATLQGQLAGVSIQQNSGNPTASNQIQIRVNASSNVNNPLFVIDGIIYDDQAYFDILDPSEVESISVLKDASAAVYGARSAGGVIIVKTKRGKEGKPKISYSGSFGVSDAVKTTEMLSAYDQATLLNDAYLLQRGYTLGDDGSVVPSQDYLEDSRVYTTDELSAFKSLDYSWLDDAWKSSTVNRHTVNVNGGSQKIRYSGSGTYYRETGNFDKLWVNKYTFRLSVDADLTDNLAANVSLSNSNKNDSRPLNKSASGAGDTETDYLRGSFATLMQAPKWMPSYINGAPVGQNGLITNHPMAVANSNSFATSDNSNTNINASLNYKVSSIKGLNLNASYSITTGGSYSKQYARNYRLYNYLTTGEHGHVLTDVLDESNITSSLNSSYKDIRNGNYIQETSALDRAYQFNAGINYANRFGKHDLSAMLQVEQAGTKARGIRAESSNILDDNLLTETQSSFGTKEKADTQWGESGRLSYIGRFNYSYSDRYLFESSFRYEASSNFLPENRWGLFPSVSIGWRMSEEPFFKDNVKFIDSFKWRLSAGILGNDRVGSRNQWIKSYNLTSSNGPIIGSAITSTLTPTKNGLVTYTTTWEKSATYNGGIDVKFANNISVSADGFYVHNYDILQATSSNIIGTVGVTSPPSTNYGVNNAWGYDIEIKYNGKLNKDWGYNLGANYAFARKKIVKVYQNPSVIGTWTDQVGTTGNREEGYIAKGIIRTQAQLDQINAEWAAKYPEQAAAGGHYTIFGKPAALGMMDYVDIGSANDTNSRNPDGIIDDRDQTVLSEYGSNPRNYGLQLGVNWKSLSLDMNFTGSYGGKVFYDKNAYTLPSVGDGSNYSTDIKNIPSFWKDHWTQENVDAKYPAVYNSNASQRSTFWMKDGHTLRLSSINLSYSIPDKVFAKMGITQVRMYLTGRNLITLINPFDYKDASLAFYNSYPILRSFNFGLSFSL